MDAIPGAYIVDNYGVTKTNAAEHIADFSQTEISRKVSEILAQESREMATDINGYIEYSIPNPMPNSFNLTLIVSRRTILKFRSASRPRCWRF